MRTSWLRIIAFGIFALQTAPASVGVPGERLKALDDYSNRSNPEGYREASTEIVVPMKRRDDGIEGTPDPTYLYLHVFVKGRCDIVHARHYHEAFITRDTQNGARYPINRLELLSSIGGEKQTKVCNSAANCSRTEQEVGMDCRASCARARASHVGFGTWTSDQACIW